MPEKDLASTIARLKKEKGAVILAHNYQPPEVQDISDHLGDSLDLSRLAASLSEEVIIFCGVHFMAETASILSPEKKIVLPDLSAGCPMADMITADQLSEFQAEHPGSATVMYVNSTAEVKALTDICCTSANALQVVESIEKDRKIIFGPDRNLGGWIASQTGRELILWNGFCPAHMKILPEQIRALRAKHPGAVVMAHPEVAPSVAAEADIMLGTGGMIRHAGENPAKVFIVGTETGMTYRLSALYPEKTFIPASEDALCRNMKKITLEKIAASLESLGPVVKVPAKTASAARRSIEQMVAIG